MNNIINIINTKENVLEFEMTIEGANSSDVDCHFVISAKNQEFRFKAKKDDNDKMWSVTIPAMPYLEKTTYKCYTEVVTDGQYFKPMTGNINVVGSAEIYSSTPKNKTVESSIEKNKVSKKEDVERDNKRKNESWRQREKSIEQIARELMNQSPLVDQKTEVTPVLETKTVKPVKTQEPVAKSVPETKSVETKKTVSTLVEKVKSTVAKELMPDIKKPNPNADKVKAILEETAKQKAKKGVVIDPLIGNEELTKAMIVKKEQELKEAKANSKKVEDPKAEKVRAILEESGIKVTKKEKISFVRK